MSFYWKKEEDGFNLYYEKEKSNVLIAILYEDEKHCHFQSDFLKLELNIELSVVGDQKWIIKAKILAIDCLITQWRWYVEELHTWKIHIDTLRKAADEMKEEENSNLLTETQSEETKAEEMEIEKLMNMLFESTEPPEYYLNENLQWEKSYNYLQVEEGIKVADLIWDKEKNYWKMGSSRFKIYSMPIYQKEEELLEAEKQVIPILVQEGGKRIKEYQKFIEIDVEKLKQYLLEFIESQSQPDDYDLLYYKRHIMEY